MDSSKNSLRKTLTGIEGLDEITNGGLPTGRTTLVCGSAGSGKTVLGMEFLVHGILDYGEPGVFMAFEETAKDLTQNVASFGYDLEQLQKDGKLAIDHVSSSAARSRRPASTTSKDFSSGSAMPSIRSRRSGWCSIPSRCCLPA